MASVELITQAGAWMLGERLGYNGAVATYKARHGSSNQHAVVVALDRDCLASAPHLAYFKAEFPRLASLPPSNLCKPMETGEEAAYVWAAFDWMPGRHLGSYVQDNGLPTAAQSLRLMARLIPAILALHEAQAVHRLITPASIFLHVDGSVRLLHTAWSGLLLGVKDGPASPHFISNLPFLAPEIARGEPGDFAADIYSLGANLYFLISGQPTHWNEDPRALAQTIGTTPAALDAVRAYAPPAVIDLIAELLEMAPADRPVNLEALAERLEYLAAGLEPVATRLSGLLVPAPPDPQLPPPDGQRPPTEESGDDDTKRLLAMARQAAEHRAESSAHIPVGKAMAAHAAAASAGRTPPPAPQTASANPPPPPPKSKGYDLSNAPTATVPRMDSAPVDSGRSPLIMIGGIVAVLLLVLIAALLYILFAADTPKPAPKPGPKVATKTATQPADPSTGVTPTPGKPRPTPTPTVLQTQYADNVERLRRLAALNVKHLRDNGTWATRTRDIKGLGAEDADLLDAWGTEHDLRDKGFIVSAGPDKKWDTKDDFWIESKDMSLGGWSP